MIKNETIDTIINQLVKGLNPEKIILFGSYGYGDPDNDSDLDILVVIPESDQPQYKRARQSYRLLRGIEAPKDIVVLTHQEFQRQVQSHSTLAGFASRKGKVLYERPAA